MSSLIDDVEAQKEIRRQKSKLKVEERERQRQEAKNRRQEREFQKALKQAEGEEPCTDINQLRTLKVITWGDLHHDSPPRDSEIDHNVVYIVKKDQLNGFNTQKLTGKDLELRKAIMSSLRAQSKLTEIINDIENHNRQCISIHCNQGRHKSVSFAHSLKDIYPNLELIHLDL